MCPCEKIILFLVAKAGKYTPGGFLDALLTNRNSGPTNEDILWQIQCNVIADLAKKGPCVIVGRCADFILKDRPDVLKVFIHADMAFRAKRIVEEYGEQTETPEQRLKDKDKRRSTYYRLLHRPEMGAGSILRYDAEQRKAGHRKVRGVDLHDSGITFLWNMPICMI